MLVMAVWQRIPHDWFFFRFQFSCFSDWAILVFVNSDCIRPSFSGLTGSLCCVSIKGFSSLLTEFLNLISAAMGSDGDPPVMSELALAPGFFWSFSSSSVVAPMREFGSNETRGDWGATFRALLAALSCFAKRVTFGVSLRSWLSARLSLSMSWYS